MTTTEKRPYRGGRVDPPSDDTESADPGVCPAHGCPLQGSLDLSGSGRFLCSAHAGQEMSRWQGITQRIREHQWLIDHMVDLRRPAVQSRWRPLAEAFWRNSEPELMQPKAFECRETFLYRLHLELLHRVGARDERPEPMVPHGQEQRETSIAAPRRPDLASLGQQLLMPEADMDERLSAAKVQAQQRVAAYHGEVA
jgi:hypothetical protein